MFYVLYVHANELHDNLLRKSYTYALSMCRSYDLHVMCNIMWTLYRLLLESMLSPPVEGKNEHRASLVDGVEELTPLQTMV
jgi:hypothetical protein